MEPFQFLQENQCLSLGGLQGKAEFHQHTTAPEKNKSGRTSSGGKWALLPLKTSQSSPGQGCFPGKAGLCWGLSSAIALIWINTLNKCSGLEQPSREWQLQVHCCNNLPVKFHPEDNPIYFPQCIQGNHTVLMEKASKQALGYSRNKKL